MKLGLLSENSATPGGVRSSLPWRSRAIAVASDSLGALGRLQLPQIPHARAPPPGPGPGALGAPQSAPPGGRPRRLPGPVPGQALTRGCPRRSGAPPAGPASLLHPPGPIPARSSQWLPRGVPQRVSGTVRLRQGRLPPQLRPTTDRPAQPQRPVTAPSSRGARQRDKGLRRSAAGWGIAALGSGPKPQ